MVKAIPERMTWKNRYFREQKLKTKCWSRHATQDGKLEVLANLADIFSELDYSLTLSSCVSNIHWNGNTGRYLCNGGASTGAGETFFSAWDTRRSKEMWFGISRLLDNVSLMTDPVAAIIRAAFGPCNLIVLTALAQLYARASDETRLAGYKVARRRKLVLYINHGNKRSLMTFRQSHNH